MFIQLALLTGGLIAGLFVGYFIRQILLRDAQSRAQRKAHAILEDARDKQKEFLLEAKNKSIQIINEAQAEERERRKEMQEVQLRLEKRESMFDAKILELENRQQQLSDDTKA